MISSFRNFAKTKFAGLLVFIMIIPFVFWGMGSMFSSGNSNNIAKINKTNISTQEFIDYLNGSGIAQETIRKNLNNNIIEELLSRLVSTTLLDLEIKDYNLLISESTILKKIKENKNFIDDKGVFQRTKYEKFLLENNQTAPQFEQRLKNRELQKNLFDYIGAGTVSPKFLIKKLYEEENKELEIEYLNLDEFYEKKENISNEDLNKFVNENIDQLKVDYIDFSYAVINPKNLIGVEGQGFPYIIDGMNAERILIASECVGDSRWFIKKSVDYSKERIVFERQIGKNQGIQFPIAQAHAVTEAAALMTEKATLLYEAGKRPGAEANMAKLLASEASWKAAEACLQTHGGYGFAEEYDVERKYRETRLYQIAPISTNLILSYIAEHVLGLPRSY